MSKIDEIMQAIEEMTILELNDLVKAMEEKFGVSAAPVAVGVVAAEGGAAPAAAEQTEFDVILANAGDKKVNVIKEAKALVDEAPKPIKEKVSKEEAEAAKAKLEEAGATVELK